MCIYVCKYAYMYAYNHMDVYIFKILKQEETSKRDIYHFPYFVIITKAKPPWIQSIYMYSYKISIATFKLF